MNNRETLSLYEWADGSCFRCAGAGDTTRIHVLSPPAGGHYDVRACRDCVLDLEAAKQRAAERNGCDYRPGRLGGDQDP